MLGFLLALQISTATWEPVHFPTLHQGFWQSCGDERVLEHWDRGRLAFEVHLGPRDEFALYANRTDHPEEGLPDPNAHNTPRNLLAPAYRVSDVPTMTGSRQWSIASLRLWVSVVRAGAGDHDECESYYVRIERK